MHHRHVLLLALVATYYGVATFALATFDAGLLVTAVVLFGLPALVLSHFTLAPAAVLVSVTLLGLGMATILEGVAHIYGLWYSLGITELRLFGVLPVEMVVALTLQVLAMALLYEVLFDDGTYTQKSAYERGGFFLAFGVAAVGLIVLHEYVAPTLMLAHSYLWLIGSLLAASVLMLMLHREFSIPFLDRVLDFSLIAAVPGALSLWLAAHNVHKVFALEHEYLDMVWLFGQSVPLEELLLLFVIPFFVAVTYELYLDDRA